MNLSLKSIRLKHNLTQNEIAKKVGITQQHYNHIELNKRNPSIKVAKKISNILDIDVLLFFPELIQTNSNIERSDSECRQNTEISIK